MSIDWEPFDDGPNTVERATINGHEVVVSLDDESHLAGKHAYYWQIDGKRGVHEGRWFDGWAGSVGAARREAVAQARSLEGT